MNYTSGTSVNVPTNQYKLLKPSNQLSCCNCTKTGHHSTNCRKYRWSQHFPSPCSVGNYTNGPDYHQEDSTIEVRNPNTVTAHNDDNTRENPSVREANRRDKIQVYKYSNVAASVLESWPIKIIHRNKLRKSHFQTHFFKQQFPNQSKCQFGIRINELSFHKFQLILQSQTNETLMMLERIIDQWFKHQEEIINENSQCLPWNKSELLSFLLDRLKDFVHKCRPLGMKSVVGISVLEKQLQADELPDSMRQKLIVQLKRAQTSVLVACYNYRLIPGAEKILNELIKLIQRLAALKIPDKDHPVPPDIYMSAVWFKFELFVPYMTREIYSLARNYWKQVQVESKSNKTKTLQNLSSNSVITPKILQELEANIKQHQTINPADGSINNCPQTLNEQTGMSCGKVQHGSDKLLAPSTSEEIKLTNVTGDEEICNKNSATDSMNDDNNENVDNTTTTNETNNLDKILTYEYSTAPEIVMESWPMKIINRVDLRRTKLQPGFFILQQFPIEANCQFSLIIFRVLPRGYEIIVKSSTNEALNLMERLITQWLNHGHEVVIENHLREHLPWNKCGLLTFLINGLSELVSGTKSTNLKLCRQISWMRRECRSLSNHSGKKPLERLKRSESLLIFACYNYNLIPGAIDTLNELQILIKRLATLEIPDNDPVPQEIYMSAVWFKFELFNSSASKEVIARTKSYWNKICEAQDSPTEHESSLSAVITPRMLEDLKTQIQYSPLDNSARININNSSQTLGERMETASITDNINKTGIFPSSNREKESTDVINNEKTPNENSTTEREHGNADTNINSAKDVAAGDDKNVSNHPTTQPGKILIYEYSNVATVVKSWPTKVINCAALPKSRLYKTFFLKQQFPIETNCQFEIQIYEFVPSGFEIIIKSQSNETLIVFEKLIEQWFKHEENVIIDNSQCLPWRKSELLSFMMDRLKELVEKTRPLTLKSSIGISNCETELESMDSDEESSKKNSWDHLVCAKSNVLMACYNYALIPGAKETLNELLMFIKRLAAVKTPDHQSVPPEFYMSAVWFKFELFVSYMTKEILSLAESYWKKHQEELKCQIKTGAKSVKETLSAIITPEMFVEFQAEVQHIDANLTNINKKSDNSQISEERMTSTNVENKSDETNLSNTNEETNSIHSVATDVVDKTPTQEVIHENKMLIFEYSNVATEIKSWKTKIIHRTTIPKPNITCSYFLKEQFPIESMCEFHVEIYKLVDNYEIILKSPMNETLIILEKLIIQWLEHEMCTLMNDTKPLPWNKLELLTYLINGLNELVKRTRPFSLNSLVAVKLFENELQSSKCEDIRVQCLNEQLRDARSNVLMACYNYNLIPGAKENLNNLPILIERLAALKIPNNRPVPSDIYMSAVWFKYELFVPYLNNQTISAAEEYWKQYQEGKISFSAVITTKMLTELEEKVQQLQAIDPNDSNIENKTTNAIDNARICDKTLASDPAIQQINPNTNIDSANKDGNIVSVDHGKEEIKIKETIGLGRKFSYEYANVDAALMKSWPSKIIHLSHINSTVNNIKHLWKQFPPETKCSFGIIVEEIGKDNFKILIKSMNNESLIIFEKLIRRYFKLEFEVIIKNTEYLPWNKTELIKLFMEVIGELVKKTKLKNMKSYISIFAVRKELHSKTIDSEKRIKLSTGLDRLYSKLILTSYNYALIPGAREILNEFKLFIERLITLQIPDEDCPVPPELYLSAVLFKFELCVPYMTQDILKTAVKFCRDYKNELKSLSKKKSKDQLLLPTIITRSVWMGLRAKIKSSNTNEQIELTKPPDTMTICNENSTTVITDKHQDQNNVIDDDNNHCDNVNNDQAIPYPIPVGNQLLYEYSNVEPTILQSWPTRILYLNQGISILLGYATTLFNQQFPNESKCQFGIAITEHIKFRHEAILKAPNQECLVAFEKLIKHLPCIKVQVIRLNSTSLPYNKSELLSYLMRKLTNLVKQTKPTNLQLVVDHAELSDELKSIRNPDGLDQLFQILKLIRRNILAASYNYALLPNARKTLNELKMLVKRLAAQQVLDNDPVPQEFYMSAVRFKFELFVSYVTTHITTTALEAFNNHLKELKSQSVNEGEHKLSLSPVITLEMLSKLRKKVFDIQTIDSVDTNIDDCSQQIHEPTETSSNSLGNDSNESHPITQQQIELTNLIPELNNPIEENNIGSDNTIKTQVTKQQKEFLFEYSNVETSMIKSWPTKIIHRDDIDKERFTSTAFFEQQFPPESMCKFSIKVIKPNENDYTIILKAPNNECLIILSKLTTQWFKRDERVINKYFRPLSWHKGKLLSYFINSLTKLVIATEPTTLQLALDFDNDTKSESRKGLERRKLETHRKRAENRLVVLMACYNYALIPGAVETLNELQMLIKRLTALTIPDNDPVPQEIYMSAVWFKFELFVSYITPDIIKAALKAYEKYEKELKSQIPMTRDKMSLSPVITFEILAELKSTMNYQSSAHSIDTNINYCPQTSVEQMETCSNYYVNKCYEPSSSNANQQIVSKNKFGIKVPMPNRCGKKNIASNEAKYDEEFNSSREDKYEWKLPFNLPKPTLERLVDNAQIVKYANAAAIYARQNNLTVMIPKIDHIVDRAKLGLVLKEEIMTLWKKINLIAPAYKDRRETTTQKRRIQRY